MAYLRFDDRPLIVAGDSYGTFLDQRDGKPSEGLAGLIIVTELAVDSEALAASLMVLGPREGRVSLAGLKPAPSVLWLLGTGEGAPLLDSYHWSDLNSP